jgi:type I restriction enzyme, S subunit
VLTACRANNATAVDSQRDKPSALPNWLGIGRLGITTQFAIEKRTTLRNIKPAAPVLFLRRPGHTKLYNQQMNGTKHSNQLPEGWKWVKLGDAGKIISGGTPSTAIPEYWKGNINWIAPSDLTGYKKKTIKSGAKSITEIGLKNSSARLMPKGSVLFSSRAPIGYVVIADEELSTNQGFKSIIPNENVVSDFLYYYLLSSKRDAEKVASGTTFKEISLSKFAELSFPLPPLPIQQAIVAKIETLFSALDKSIENLRLAQQQLKTYRQSVLKWAFEGRLTHPQVKEGALPEGWRIVTLKNVCDKIQDGSHFSPQVQYDEPGQNRFKYITAKNIRNDYMDFRKVTYVNKDFHDSIYSRCNPEFGDVLLTKDGINTGDVTLNTLHEPFSLLSSVCIFKTKKTDLLSPFLKYFIQSPLGSEAILDSMTGTAIKRIVLKKIKDSKIVLPPLPEQHQIVQAIESRLSVADKTAESIAQSLQQAEALRQGILKKAFEGRLV